jgi:hypothetical protein
MRCTIVLEFDNGDANVVKRVEVMRFHRAAGEEVGRRICKSQPMRWGRLGAHSVAKLRVRLLSGRMIAATNSCASQRR